MNNPPDDSKTAALVQQACARMAGGETDIAAIVAGLPVSRSHFQRVFRQLTGVTPKAYAAQCRLQRLQQELPEAQTVTASLFDAGFQSSSRFYAATATGLGMTPTTYRKGGRGEQIRFAVGHCRLGAILVAATARGVCRIQMDDQPEPLLRDLEAIFPHAELIGGDAEFEGWMAAVVGLVETPAASAHLPLDIQGTAFQRRVWQALCAIPPGSTASYAEVAATIGQPTASRAVARACATNPLALAIPCHRVVRHDGGLSGYRWGIARKQALLEREAALCRES